MKLNFIFILLLMNFLCKSSFGSETNNNAITISQDNPEKSIDPMDIINKRQIHIVKKGDSILSISRRYSLNKDYLIKINKLKDENFIFVGQTLILTEENLNKLDEKNKNIPKYHEILEGENLTDISNRYGLNINDLINFNNLDNPDKIKVGTNLLLINPPENIEKVKPLISKISNNKLLDSQQYGPLTIESSKLEVIGGRKILNAINIKNEKLILSIKCETKEIDVRKTGRKWQGWMPVKENFEKRLINDFC